MKFEKQLLLSLFIYLSFVSYGQSPESSCLTLNDIKIFPNESDWDANGLGKVLISSTDGTFHTPYQTQNRKLKIRVELPPQWVGDIVYFLIEDPDDPSSYETNTDGGDNWTFETGTLDHTKVTAKNRTGSSNAIAENILTITNQYSGNNYKVLVSLTEPVHNHFPIGSIVKESMVFTAWKNLKVEYTEMYRVGSFATSNLKKGTQKLSIEVHSKVDFTSGMDVTFINTSGTPIYNAIIFGISTSNNPKTLFFDLDQSAPFIPLYSAIVPTSELNSKYSFGAEYIDQAYSKECTNDSDGGTFTEIYTVISNKTLPNFNPILEIDILTPSKFNMNIRPYLDAWINFNINDNIIDGIACGTYTGPTSSSTFGLNIRDVYDIDLFMSFIGNIENSSVPSSSFSSAAAEVYVHELGHSFGVQNSHVDKPIFYPNGCNIGGCIMTHGSQGNMNLAYDGITKFDIDLDGCIYSIRNAVNPR